MNGVELTSAELAYLLATLNCSSVPGLEDPALFPGSASSQGKTYKKGRNELMEHGWMKPVTDREEEYELDPLLLEAVSVLANPNYMIASSFTIDNSDSQMMFHYLSGENTIELVAADKKSYWLGALDTREQLAERIAELMQIKASNFSAEVILEESLEDINAFVGNGKQAEAERALKDGGLDDDQVQSLLTGFEEGSRGSLVVLNLDNGEISSGRRFFVYGSGDSAWMSSKSAAQSPEVLLRPCSPEAIGDFLTTFLEQ